MRFLVDESTGPQTAHWLSDHGHDVLSAFHSLRGTTDDVLLSRAVAEDRILVTNDRDFGELIFRDGRAHCGVVFLRLADERPVNKIAALARLLAQHAHQLSNEFIVVTETQIRFAGGASP